MTSYILAPEALQGLQELWDYIATENLDAADRMIDTLFVRLLSGSPRCPA
jgi:plasmid stabilization system protein ParE